MPEAVPGDHRHDLLHEPLFAVHRSPPGRPDLGQATRITLPQAVAHLITGTDIEFDRLPVEMAGSWWRFLGRLGAGALHEWGADVEHVRLEDPAEVATRLADTWERLAPRPAWHLWVLDPHQPAFEQPPLPAGGENPYQAAAISDLTLALGGKNHERKTLAVQALAPDAVAYHLVALQGGAIYGGVGRYGSQLMGSKSGAGSGTPFVGVWIGGSSSRSYQYEVGVFLEYWPRIVHEHQLRGDTWALWTLPWDGASALPSQALSPAFLPLGRRLRLGPPSADGEYRSLWVAQSSCDRVRDHTGGGDLGDPWLALVPNPKAKKGDWAGSAMKVRGTMASGYGYAEVLRLLKGEGCVPAPVAGSLARRWPAPDATLPPDHAANRVWLRCEGVAYGQGKTEGFHARLLLLPSQVQVLLADPDRVDVVVALLQGGIREARQVLRNATRVYLTGAPTPKKGDDARVGRVIQRLDQQIDAVFLDHLSRGIALVPAPGVNATPPVELEDGTGDPWAGAWADAPATEAAEALAPWLDGWCQWLGQACLETWDAMRPHLPCPQDRRLEREVRAESKLRGQLSVLVERVRNPAVRAEDDRPEPDLDSDGESGVEESP